MGVKKSTFITIIIFGALLAVFSFVLHYFEFRYSIRQLDQDIYTAVVATLFTVVGLWIGLNFIRKKSASPIPENGGLDLDQVEKLQLNSREYEILQLISEGMTNQQIADKLFLALPTIKTHTSNLYVKLDVKNRTQAVYRAKELNILV